MTYRVVERRWDLPEDRLLFSDEAGGVAWTRALDLQRRYEEDGRGPCSIIVIDPNHRERASLPVRDPAICIYCAHDLSSAHHRKSCDFPEAPSIEGRKRSKKRACNP